MGASKAAADGGNCAAAMKAACAGGRSCAKAFGKDRRIEEQEAVLRGLYGRRRAACHEPRHGLSDVGSESCHVHQTRHVRGVAGLGDDHTAVGMADEQGRAALPRSTRSTAATSSASEVKGF
jgi:hypothetical protein